jgi:cyclophilin family peptidyl-prolyl cis-trans isomerase
MKKSSFAIIMSTLSLTFVGVGCAGGNQVAVPASSANGETALSTTPSQVDLYAARQDAAPAPSPAAAPAEGAAAPQPAADAKWPKPTKFPGLLPSEEIHGKAVHIKTAKGEIVFELLDGEAPKTVSNFVALAKSGYYDGLTFHRYVPGFVIQGGDPSGNGTGGPGYKFEDETVKLDYDAGIVAMANAGPNTNGSQFFIMLEDTPLDKLYTIFGRVTSGLDVVRALRVGDRMDSVTVTNK